MKPAKILGILVIAAFIFTVATPSASALAANNSNVIFGFSQNGLGYDLYPYNAPGYANYFGVPSDPMYNSFNHSYGYSGTQAGMYGVPYAPSVNDDYYIDEDPNFIPNLFGAMSASNRYAGYNNMGYVDSYYGLSNSGYSGYSSGYSGYSNGYSNGNYGLVGNWGASPYYVDPLANGPLYQDPLYGYNNYNSGYGGYSGCSTCAGSSGYYSDDLYSYNYGF
jgi:hypothetical protein